MERLDICPQTIFEFTATDTLTAYTLAKARELTYRVNKNNLISEDLDILSNGDFSRAKRWCQDCLDEVTEEVYPSIEARMKITQSWINQSEKGMWHHSHRHPNSFISGVFYLTTSASDSGLTWFSTENLWHYYAQMCEFQLIDGPKPRVIHQEPALAGKLLLFSSIWNHSVDENMDETPRITLGFNTFIRGTVGTGGLNMLNL